MARLVPALCPQFGGHVSLDPAKEWVTSTYCRATSFAETPACRADRITAQGLITIDLHHTPPKEHLSPKEQRWVYLVVEYGGDLFGGAGRAPDGESSSAATPRRTFTASGSWLLST